MLPPTRVPRSRRDKRRSHHALRAVNAAVCPNCGTARLPHAACSNCGYVRPGLTIKLSKED